MSEKAVDLAQLRQRLAKLGVHIADSVIDDECEAVKPGGARTVRRTATPSAATVNAMMLPWKVRGFCCLH